MRRSTRASCRLTPTVESNSGDSMSQKFDPPDSQTVNKRTVRPVIAKYRDLANVDAAFDKLVQSLGRLAGSPSDDYTGHTH